MEVVLLKLFGNCFPQKALPVDLTLSVVCISLSISKFAVHYVIGQQVVKLAPGIYTAIHAIHG